MNFRRLLTLFCVICFALMSISLATATAAEKKKTFKIGLMYDLTGGYGPFGTQATNAVELAIEMGNKSGGIKGHEIEYVVLDGQSETNKSVLTVKRLIDLEKVHVVMGGINGAIALAIASVCEENKVPFLTTTPMETFELTLKPKPYWSFRPARSGWEEVSYGLGVAERLAKGKRLAMLFTNISYGKLSNKLAKYFAPQRGLELVAEEPFDIGSPDLGAQISNIMAAKPDVIYITIIEQTGALAVKQMRERGLNVPIVSQGGAAAPQLQNAFKDVYSIPNYVYATAGQADVWELLPKDSPDYKVLAPIASAFEKRYGVKYGAVPVCGTNAFFPLKDAFERALKEDPKFLNKDLQSVRAGIRQKLETLKHFNTGMGCYTMSPENHSGAESGTGILTVHWENGKMVYDQELSKVKALSMAPAKIYE